MRAKAVVLTGIIWLAGCAGKPAPVSVQTPVQPSRPAQVLQPQPAPVSVQTPVQTPAPRPSNWLEGVTRNSQDGLAIRLIPSASYADGAARVRWEANGPVNGVVVGVDGEQVIAVIDHTSAGKTRGEVDAFRSDLERVKSWRVYSAKAWPNG